MIDRAERSSVAAYLTQYGAKAIMTLEAVLRDLGAVISKIDGKKLQFRYKDNEREIDLTQFVSAIVTIDGSRADPLVADLEAAHDKTLRVIERLLTQLS